MKTLHVNGKPLDDSSSRVCVLYDPKDGRVVHIHGVTTVHGGKTISDADLADRTIEHAKVFGHSVSGLKPLHVPLSALRQRGTFKVNAEGTDLILSWEAPVRTRDLFEQRHNVRSRE